MMTDWPAHVVLFGAGRIGRIHAANLVAHPGARLVGIVDLEESAAAGLARACATRPLDAAAAFADPTVTAIVIASPTDTHADLIEAAAAAGKAVLCEKPVDLDVERARRAVATAQRAGILLAIGFNRRFDPSFQALHAALAAGQIGVVETVLIISRDPAPPPAEYVRRSGGLFRDMTIHDLDLARWLLGEEPQQVIAQGSCLVDAAISAAGDIDTAAILLRTSSGRIAQISNSRRAAWGYDQRIEVAGSTGLLQADNQHATTVTCADARGYRRDPALPFFLERYAEAYRLELDAFLRRLRGEPIPLVSGEDGVRALELADAAWRSLVAGSMVTLEPAP